MDCPVFEFDYAGHAVTYTFADSRTRYLFHPWPKKSQNDVADIHVTTELLEKARPMLPEGSSDAYVEYRCLIGLTGKELLKYDCCIFHCVSFIWKGKAWLLAAPSGIGKTTQYKNWIRLFPNEIIMISGDMPVLEIRPDTSIWAHPTSWNGKENIGNRKCAPVAGVVLLKQDSSNQIRRVLPGEALIPIFRQFIVRPESENEIAALSRIIDQMLSSLPIWEMRNRGDEDSTVLLRDTLERYNESEVFLSEDVIRTRDGFVLTETAGEYLLINTCSMGNENTYVSQLNETSAFIWHCLERGCTRRRLLDKVLNRYDFENINEVEKEIDGFLQLLQQMNYIQYLKAEINDEK